MTKKWVRSGPAAKSFEAVDVLPTLARKAADISGAARPTPRRASRSSFISPAPRPHTPLVPTPEWQGKSPLGPYGDFVMETDWATGEVLKALDEAGVADEHAGDLHQRQRLRPVHRRRQTWKRRAITRAPSSAATRPTSGTAAIAFPSSPAGPATSKQHPTSDQLTCLTDLLATCSDLLAERLPDNAGEDSVSILPALLGPRQGAAARGGRTPFHQRAVRHPPRHRGSWNSAPARAAGVRRVDPQAVKMACRRSSFTTCVRTSARRSNVEAANPRSRPPADQAAGKIRRRRP